MTDISAMGPKESMGGHLMIFMRVLVPLVSDGVKYVFIGTNGIQSPPPTYTLIADKLLMRFMTQAMI